MSNADSPTDTNGRQRSEQVRQIVKECLLARAGGQVTTDESVIQAHPDLMPELANELRNLRRIEEAERQADQLSSSGLHIRCPHCRNPVELVEDASLSDVVCPSCGSGFSLTDDTDRTFQASEQELVNHFRLLDRVGVGAFGSVWSARDTQLDRIVALKIPRKGQLSPEEVEQFIREARAAAQLKHPHIVSVLEVGRYKDRIYIACDFVQGLDLADWLTDQQATPREAAELCATMADALQHAHDHGVIHRDIKPSNIMLDTSGEPHLMDFGLAKREAGEMTMTIEGKLLGTPAYMSPEQARGSAHDADARSDVYSLGVILFELLTGERPFRGSTRMLLHQVLVEDSPSPRRLNGNVPKDLETICLKCLDKAPERRYQAAAELRDDLGRYLRGEPVLARPITKVARGWRWCKRKPVVAGLSAAIACLLVSLSIVGPMVATRQASLRQDAQDSTKLAKEESENRRRLLYIADMNIAQQALKRSQIAKVIEVLERHQPAEGEEDLRGFGWYYLWAACQRSIMQPTIEGEHVRDVHYSSDGKTITTADIGLGLFTQRDVGTLVPQRTIGFDNGGADTFYHRRQTFSPDGRVFAIPLLAGGIRLVNTETGEDNLLGGSSDSVLSITFSSDGKMLASGYHDGSVILWNLTTGRQALELKQHVDQKAHEVDGTGQNVTSVAFSPDGQTLATGSRDQTAKLWNVATGELLETIKTKPYTEKPSSVWSVAISPDGNNLAIGTSGDNVVLLWDVANREYLRTIRGHSAFVNRLAFYDDGKKLASGGSTLRLWDVDKGEPVDSPRNNEMFYAPFLKFSPDESTLAAAYAGGVKLWRLDDPANPRVRRFPNDWDKGLFTISPDGTTSVMGTRTGKIEVWNMTTGEVTCRFSHGVSVTSVSWNDRSRQVATRGVDGKIKLWNGDTGDELLKPLEHESADSKFVGTQFLRDSDSDILIAVGKDLSVYSWDLAVTNPRRKRIHSHKLDRKVLAVHGWVLAGGQILRTWVQEESGKSLLALWDIATDELIKAYPDPSCDGLSADRSRWAICTLDGEIIVWNMADKKEIRLPGHEASVKSIRFSPDGRRLFSGGNSMVKVWDIETRTMQFELEAHSDQVIGIYITPDSRTLTTISADRTVQQWRTATDNEVQQMRKRWHEIHDRKKAAP